MKFLASAVEVAGPIVAIKREPLIMFSVEYLDAGTRKSGMSVSASLSRQHSIVQQAIKAV
jgi:hypothetical protein